MKKNYPKHSDGVTIYCLSFSIVCNQPYIKVLVDTWVYWSWFPFLSIMLICPLSFSVQYCIKIVRLTTICGNASLHGFSWLSILFLWHLHHLSWVYPFDYFTFVFQYPIFTWCGHTLRRLRPTYYEVKDVQCYRIVRQKIKQCHRFINNNYLGLLSKGLCRCLWRLLFIFQPLFFKF